MIREIILYTFISFCIVFAIALFLFINELERKGLFDAYYLAKRCYYCGKYMENDEEFLIVGNEFCCHDCKLRGE